MTRQELSDDVRARPDSGAQDTAHADLSRAVNDMMGHCGSGGARQEHQKGDNQAGSGSLEFSNIFDDLASHKHSDSQSQAGQSGVSQLQDQGDNAPAGRHHHSGDDQESGQEHSNSGENHHHHDHRDHSHHSGDQNQTAESTATAPSDSSPVAVDSSAASSSDVSAAPSSDGSMTSASAGSTALTSDASTQVVDSSPATTVTNSDVSPVVATSPVTSSDATPVTTSDSATPVTSDNATPVTTSDSSTPAATDTAQTGTDTTGGVVDHPPGTMVGLDKMPVGIVQSNYADFTTSDPQNMTPQFLEGLKAQGIGAVQNIYDLPTDRLLNQSELDFIDRDYAAAREAGMPMITRFVYAQNAGDPDAPASQIIQQLKDLAPVLSKNEDVIGVMDMGFVGAWGEWNRSTNNPLNDKDFALQQQMYDIYSQAIPNTPIAFSHADTIREMFGDNSIPNNVMVFDDSIGKQNGTTSTDNDSGEFYQPGDYEWAEKSHVMYTGENQEVGRPDLVLQRIHDLNITAIKLWGPVEDAIDSGGYLPQIEAALKANAVADGIPVQS